MYEVLEGENIRLRKAREEDYQSMLKHVWSDEAVYRWMLYQPTLTEKDAIERCRRSMEFQKDHYAYFVALKDTDEALLQKSARLPDATDADQHSDRCLDQSKDVQGYRIGSSCGCR